MIRDCDDHSDDRLTVARPSSWAPAADIPRFQLSALASVSVEPLHCLNTIMVVRGRAFVAEIRFKHPYRGARRRVRVVTAF
jgi:hypothetical protein